LNDLSKDTLVTVSGVNAFDYMLLARMIHFFVPSKSIWGIKPSLLAVVFVTLDFASFVIQLVGGGMAGPGSPHDQIMKGLL
jgi:RTA1 like protein